MKLVLFDVDLTLLKVPDEANRESSRVMFREVFKIAADEELIENTGMTEMGIIRAVLGKVNGGGKETESHTVEVPESAYKVWADAAIEIMKTQPAVVLPGVIELLGDLQKDPEVKLGLLSGNSYWRAEAKLKSGGLDGYFRDESGQLLGAFGNESEKREGLIEIAKNRLGNPNDTTTLVDDSSIGAEMAQRLSVPAIMVATGKASVEELSYYVPHVLPNFSQGRSKVAADIIKRL